MEKAGNVYRFLGLCLFLFVVFFFVFICFMYILIIPSFFSFALYFALTDIFLVWISTSLQLTGIQESFTLNHFISSFILSQFLDCMTQGIIIPNA